VIEVLKAQLIARRERHNKTLLVVAPYQAQVDLLQQAFNKLMLYPHVTWMLATADSIHGREVDVAIALHPWCAERSLG
jgi:hypothetical protein